jgi:hypothetical protein
MWLIRWGLSGLAELLHLYFNRFVTFDFARWTAEVSAPRLFPAFKVRAGK